MKVSRPIFVSFIIKRIKTERWLHELSSKIEAKQSVWYNTFVQLLPELTKQEKNRKSSEATLGITEPLYTRVCFLFPVFFSPLLFPFSPLIFLTLSSHLGSTNIYSYIQIRVLEFAKHSHITCVFTTLWGIIFNL